MGYSICKEGKTGFRILFESWDDGIKTKRHVKKQEWSSLGIQHHFSIEDARKTVQVLNSEQRILTSEKKRNRLELKRAKENSIENAYLPPLYVKAFEKEIMKGKNLRDDHWESAKRVIRAVNVKPEDWYFLSHLFYNYFAQKGYSLDYSNRLRRILNEWGRFYSRKKNAFWESIPAPRGKFANKIRDEYQKKTNGGRFRARLSLELLRKNKSSLNLSEYNWLLISVAFGLRPEEINKSLKTPGKWGFKNNALYVYQYKLERTEPNPKRRWKKIDIHFEHQREARKVIMAGKFHHPSRRKLRQVFGEKMTYYGGRKEFFPFMKKQFDAYTVSSWLGHRSLETSRRYYDDPEEDSLPTDLEFAS